MSDIRRFRPHWMGKTCLSVGSAWTRIISGGRWVNMDLDPRAEPEVVGTAQQLPFLDKSFGFVLASHVLEHIHDPFPAMSEIWRVLEPGGRLLIVVPHALGYPFMIPPQHVRAFLPDSFKYFCPTVYETEDTHGSGAYEGRDVHPWDIESVEVSAGGHWNTLAKYLPRVFDFLSNHLFGVLEDIYVLMRRPSEVQ